MIEIKQLKGQKKYQEVTQLMNKHIQKMSENIKEEEIWFLEHENVFTAGSSTPKEFRIDEINKIPVIKVNRGGKITYHGPGQLIFYFVIDLKKRKKDIRKFISVIEKSIIDTLKIYNIKSFADKDNIGIWYNDNTKIKKIAAIGIKVSKWIAYHGFSINISNDLKKYDAIIPCGIKDKGVTNLYEINDQNYKGLEDKIIENFILNLKNLSV